MKHKRLFTLLLALCLIFSMVPTGAAAAELKVPASVGEVMGQVNPLAEDLPAADVREKSAELTEVIAKKFYSTAEPAADVIRAAMVARQPSVVIGLTKQAYSTSLLYEIMDKTLAHTGVPNEGDYLTCHGIAWEAQPYESSSGISVEFKFTYITSADNEAQVDAAVDALLAELNLWNSSDYDKIKGVYDWICTNVAYDYELQGGLLAYSTYAALINRSAVCQGYAGLFYRLMLELGVDCRVITGEVDGGAHAWNIVKLNGVYYNVDATFDAIYRQADMNYSYFLVSDLNFLDHVADSNYTSGEFVAAYPKAEYNYDDSNDIAWYGYCGAEGEYGENLIWYLYDGVLVIVGEGAMTDYEVGSDAPWKNYNKYITGIYVDEGVTYIGEDAFCDMRYVTDAILPGTLDVIGACAFQNCSKLETVEVPYGLKKIGESAFFYSNLTNFVIPDSVTEIGAYAFRGTKFKSIVIPGGVTVLESGVFTECKLESVILPETLTTIKDSAFSLCEGLKTIDLPESLTSIGDSAFVYSGLTEITIPDNVTSLNSSAFSNCNDLRSITFGSGVVSFDASSLVTCPNFECYTVSEGNTVFAAVDGVLFSKDMTTLIHYPTGKANKNYTVPESVTTISECAFRGAQFSTIQLPSNLTSIGDTAFSGCGNMTTLTIPAGVKVLSENCLFNCPSLASLTLPEGLVVLEESSLAHCGSLTSLVLPESLERIEEGVFTYSGLTHLVIPQNVTYLGSAAFNSSKLKDIEFKGDAPEFHASAFFPKTVTVYYPAGNETWTEDVMQQYGGTITWKAACEEHTYDHDIKPNTCTEDGLAIHTCTTCGLSYEEILPAAHTYTNDQDTICDVCTCVRHIEAEYPPNPPVVHMFRMYDPNSGEHFYTGSEVEKYDLLVAGWNYEGVGFSFPVVGAPVYRLYDPVYGEHLYTMDIDEVNYLIGQGWNNEGVAFNTAPETEVPQYRLHNPNEKRGAYHFTSSAEERDNLLAVGWEYQGIGWYSCWK